jgi:hypothetical protein
MVTTDMGFAISEPISLENTMVDNARMVVKAVIRTGRILVLPASIIASLLDIPFSRS